MVLHSSLTFLATRVLRVEFSTSLFKNSNTLRSCQRYRVILVSQGHLAVSQEFKVNLLASLPNSEGNVLSTLCILLTVNEVIIPNHTLYNFMAFLLFNHAASIACCISIHAKQLYCNYKQYI